MQPITTAMMVRASQASLGSSGVCVSELISEDAKLVAAPLARSLFSRPKGRGQRGDAAGTPWRSGPSFHPTRLASQQCTQMPQNGAERPFSPICVHSLSPRLSTTAHLTERRTLHSPLDRGETKKRILFQRLTKNRSLVSPGVVECAFPSRRGAREVWGNPPPGCGALWRMAQLGRCARATPRQAEGRLARVSADLGSESGLTEKRTLQPTQPQ